MGFAINPSHNYLQINESFISEFCRSTNEVALPDARFRGHPFEAYICTTRVEKEMRAYVALLNTALQSVLVYSSDFVARNAGDYPKVYAEAEAFVESMGFTMEKVNLDFSPAMREVILKGFRVMRPPIPPKKQLHRQPKVDVPVGLGIELDISSLPSDENTNDDGLQDSSAELQTLRTELVSARAALAQVTREKVSLEQRFSQELAALQSACEQAMESRHQAEDLLARAKADKEAVESLLAVEKAANLAAAGRIESLAIAEHSWKEGQQQTEELSRSLAAVEEELKGAYAGLEKLQENRLAGVEISAEIGQALKEKEAVEAEYVRLANSSREKEAELLDRLAVAEAENERLSRELEIQGQVATMEQTSLRAELRRLIAEVHATPFPLSEITVKLAPAREIPEQTSDQGVLSGLAQVEPPEKTLDINSPEPCASPAPGVVKLLENPLEEEPDESPDELIALETTVMKEFTNEYGGISSGRESSGTEFRIDQSIDCIEYGNPREIVVVFHSSNTVQAVPDGSSIQSCRGYVIALKQAGSYRVYVAWHLTGSGKVVVCLPDQQPVDSDGCVQVLRDAISYFEIVGFMMDIADLGTTVNSYSNALKKIPVFCNAIRS